MVWAKSQDSVLKRQFLKRKESRSGSNLSITSPSLSYQHAITALFLDPLHPVPRRRSYPGETQFIKLRVKSAFTLHDTRYYFVWTVASTKTSVAGNVQSVLSWQNDWSRPFFFFPAPPSHARLHHEGSTIPHVKSAAIHHADSCRL